MLLSLLSAARKTFVNWKLRNQKPNLNETCLIYVPLQYLSFPKKWRCQWLSGGGGASKNPPKNAKKIHKTLTLTSPKSSLKNTIKAGFFWTVIVSKLMANWWTGFYMISTTVMKGLIWGKGGFNPIRGCLLLESNFTFKSALLL